MENRTCDECVHGYFNERWHLIGDITCDNEESHMFGNFVEEDESCLFFEEKKLAVEGGITNT